jgi:tetratricopeptide (TPR) repeat protein
MKRRLLLAVALVAIMPLTIKAQLFGPNFYASSITSPELLLDKANKIAVLNFKDENNPNYNYWNDTKDNGAQFADYIIANLLNEKLGLTNEKKLYITGFRTNIYTVVERSQIESVLREQKLGVSGVIDDSQATQAGKLLGVDLMIAGGVSFSHKDERKEESSKKTDGTTETTYTLIRTVYAVARVKYIDVESGQIKAVKEFTVEESESKSSKSYISSSAMTLPAQLADKAYSRLAGIVTKYFTPVYEYTSYDILKIKNKEYKDQSKDAIDFIKDGEIDKAFIIYNKIQEADPYSQEAAYNLGALLEGTGNYEKALEKYKLAAEIDTEDKRFKESIKRAEAAIKTVKWLSTKGVEVKPYEFAAEGSGSSKLADKVTTRGKEKDRVDVHETMNESSSVVAKVPGNTEFEVLEKNGEWLKIKLLGGKAGYIQASNVK